MANNQHPLFAPNDRHSFFASDNRPQSIFNSAGFFKQLAGFSTRTTGKLVICELCKNKVLFLHQYKRYEEKYCCINCIDLVIERQY